MNFRILLETQAQAQVLKEKFDKLGYKNTNLFNSNAALFICKDSTYKGIEALINGAYWSGTTQTISYEALNQWLDEQIKAQTPQMRPMTEQEIFELWKSNGFRLVVRYSTQSFADMTGYDSRYDEPFMVGFTPFTYQEVLKCKYTLDNGATWNKFETEDK